MTSRDSAASPVMSSTFGIGSPLAAVCLSQTSPRRRPANRAVARPNVARVSDTDAIARVREICLALPEVAEKPLGGHKAPAVGGRDKLFVTTSEDGGYLTFKAAPGVQEALVAAEPERFFVPAYVGSK